MEKKTLLCGRNGTERGHAKNMSTCPIVLFRDVYSQRQLTERHDDFPPPPSKRIYSIHSIWSFFFHDGNKKQESVIKREKRKENGGGHSETLKTRWLTFRRWGVEFFAQLLDSAIMTQLFYGLSSPQLHHLSELFKRNPILGRPSVHHRHLEAGFFSSRGTFFFGKKGLFVRVVQLILRSTTARRGVGKTAPTPQTNFGQLSPMTTMSFVKQRNTSN